ncbi:hypothetical protein K504DRAFT_460544 [Pleomassaria siparia CBS 279.74]|uniref:Alpha/beta-hydrolase n=1 Tax=Pleomassaria siparia CBS 279.74 TaxID=1314801 RepID=A0A6G1JXL7_9PLEO|nr:hypothetical protein K504DRAFT_460544 [Pleomassaria siparia CBS 279.74]
MHAFSEGGSNKAVELAEAYYSTTGTRLPCSALCLDSTLGHPRYLRLCNALQRSLPPSPILRSAGIVLGGACLGGIWTLYACIIGFSRNVVSQTRARIVDPQIWDLSAPRCYLYSEADKLIDFRDIQEHVRGALLQGTPLMDICFEGSDHCKHAAQDPDRYWRAVMMTWQRQSTGET